ncbi:MAG: ribonuclease P protein component [Oceanicaulis sp.]|nr:ribonuclease P protein component [Oceanicaulis sp.]MAZ92300.1 ribonuclease P protein component [Maricaulis sp.]MBI74214.1 ribonuclease P protein component [Oceanicaulis sp.]
MDTQPLAVNRLKKRREFLFVAQGKKAVRSSVVIQARRRDGSSCLCDTVGAGFTATRKIGGAVVRNRCKRRLREAARLLLPLHGQPGFDYVFIARASTSARDWPRLMGDVKSALVSLAEDGAAGGKGQTA